jgi:acyl-CoA thioester hydrolase
MTDDLLHDFPVIHETEVAWGDMDAFQHVNNAVYLRYFESARIRYFEQTPMFEIMQAEGVGPIVHSHRIRYRFPLTYPDRIRTGVRITGVGRDRIRVAYRLVSTKHGVIAAEGDTTIVFLNYNSGEKAPVPEPVLTAFDRLEGWTPDTRPPFT